MADAPAFTKLVPGFDFLQGLVQDAGSALPHIGQWVAPTLNPEELEKRIEELRTCCTEPVSGRARRVGADGGAVDDDGVGLDRW